MNIRDRRLRSSGLAGAPAAAFLAAACFFLAVLGGCEDPPPSDLEPDFPGLTDQLLLPPSDIVVTDFDSARIRLQWKDNAIRETAIEVEQSVNGQPFTVIAALPPNTDTLTLTGPFRQQERLQFRLRARRLNSVGEPSARVEAYHEETYLMLMFFTDNAGSWDGIFRLRSSDLELVRRGDFVNTYQFDDIHYLGDSLIVAGPFTRIGTVLAPSVAVLHNDRWTGLGNSLPLFGPFRIVSGGGRVYVVGGLAPNLSHAAYWNGTSYFALPTPPMRVGGRVIGGIVEGERAEFVIDVGTLNNSPLFDPIAVSVYQGLVRVNHPQPLSSRLADFRRVGIARYQGALHVALTRTLDETDPGADTTLVRFDGFSWSVVDVSGARRQMQRMVSWNGSMYAAFDDLNAGGGTSVSSVARWNGSSWSVIRQSSEQYYQLWDTPNGLLANRRTTFGSTTLEKWDGVTWTVLRQFDAPYGPRAIAAKSAWKWRRL